MPREDGYKNLVPMDKRSKDEARILGERGGVASGASRRRKRSLKECADYYLALPPADKRRWNKISRQGVEPEEIDNQMAMIIGLTERAIKGDAKAAKVIIDLLGEKPGEEKNRDGILADLIDGLIEDDLYTETEIFDEGLADGETETD